MSSQGHIRAGLAWVMKNLESHGIYYLNFQAWKVVKFLVKVMEKQYVFGKLIKRQKDKKFGKKNR